MTVYGFHASHEQLHPRDLLTAVCRAEQAGFTAAMCSDHFSPWSARQGHSGYAWSWLGAALQATSLPLGVVTAPGQRYHPAVTAQAVGTLAAMYPGRFWAALGSGEAANEHITGGGWPRKEVRDARLLECVQVIRSLLAGDEVSHEGLVTVDRARLWTLPEAPPPLLGAAVGTATAGRCAGWADGLITVNAPFEQVRAVVREYRGQGGRGPVYVQAHVSWAPTQEEAAEIAYDQWRSNVFAPPVCWDTSTVEEFDEISRQVPAERVAEVVHVCADLGRQAAYLHNLAGLGVDGVFVHHVGRQQEAFLDAFGEHVLPQLDITAPAPHPVPGG